MKSTLRSPVLFSGALFLLAASFISAADSPRDDKSAPVSAQKAQYPLTTCVVSDDKLDEMGKPMEYVYKEAGKPDRLVLFCCKDCVADFEKEPAKYLKKIDEAAAKKAADKK